MRVLSLGRYRAGPSYWKLQLGSRDHDEIYAEVEIPDDQVTLTLAEEFMDALAAAKGLTVKPRRNSDA